MNLNATHNWTEEGKYTGYTDEQVAIDFTDVEEGPDGEPIRWEVVYTDLTGGIESQDLEAFAHADASDIFAGGVIRSSGWVTGGHGRGKGFVVEVTVPGYGDAA